MGRCNGRRHRRPSWEFLMSLLIAISGSTSTIGILSFVAADARAAVSDVADNDTTLKCAAGWSGGEDMQEIPKSWINDGYCDCPLDGKDEPDTGACSGSQSWPGVGLPSTPPFFACPQQPKLKLPLSRVHDGICDCCDGRDEPPSSKCPDICDKVLKVEREARAKAEMNFKVGSQKRQADLQAFGRRRESKLKDMGRMEAKVAETAEEIEAVKGQILQLKQSYAKLRLSTMKDKVVGHQDMVALIHGLERQELQHLIIHSCQVAGEILSNEEKSDTCVALRMAGLDLGLTWDDDDFDNFENMKGQVDISLDIVELLFDNASNGGALNWKKDSSGGKSKRRRLDEVVGDEEDYMGSFDGDYDGAFASEDYDDGTYGDDDLVDNSPPKRNKISDHKVLAAEGKKKEFIDEVMGSHLSKTRASFLSRSKDILDAISRTMDADVDDDGEVAKTEEGGKAETEANDSGTKFDPAVYTMVRNELRRRESTIQRGLSWAASAKLLFAFSNQSDENLQRLAVGTLYYGQLGAAQVWQILQSILPEYVNVSSEIPSDTCASPWASSCPPKPIYRKGASYPPSFILAAAGAFCEQQASSNIDIVGSCAAPAEESITIPSSIPDGYYGYFFPLKRNDFEGDPLSALFAPIDKLPIDTEGLQTLETRKNDLERNKKDAERSIADAWKDIGGKDGDQMGPDGELHAMADKCYDILAGKYTYEVCIFGRAAQKEGDRSGGTDLGNWKGMDFDESSGQRVMRWADGQKCWNGPKRSATVYLTCGAENKIISADEPDTCRYVFQMESYIACDEGFKVRNGL